jgi:hypothetical protein
MRFLTKSLIMAGAFFTIRALRKKREDVKSTSATTYEPYNDNTTTTENDIPDIKVEVEKPVTTATKH